jgi:hypothetical protein
MKGLLHFSADTAACLKQGNKIGVKWRGRPNSSSSVENEIKKRAQILLHFQLKMLQDMKSDRLYEESSLQEAQLWWNSQK